MKVRRSALALIALIPITCGGLDQIAVTETARAQIRGATLLEQFTGSLGFDGFTKFDIKDNTELQNQGVEPHQIDSVKVTTIRLTVSAPQGGDMSFLDSLEFYAESDGLPRVRIASGGPFPAGQSVVELTVDDTELAPYATADEMTITTEATGNRPNDDTTIDASLELLVDINVDGVVCGE